MKNEIDKNYDIDWSFVEDIQQLREGAEYFESKEDYSQSKELLIKAYKLSKFKAHILKSLIKVSLKLNQVNDAKNYLDEYYASYSKDVDIEYLEYKVSKKLGMSTDLLIEILQNLQDEYYAEEWMYDLACEYENAGLIQDCINQCEKIELWFDRGLYVSRALRLKKRYKPLTDEELEKIKEFDEEIANEITLSKEENIIDSDKSKLVQSSAEHEEPENILNDEDYDMKIYNPTKNLSENKKEINIIDSILKDIEECENLDNSVEDSMFGLKKKKTDKNITVADLENEDYVGDLQDVEYFDENDYDEYFDEEYLGDEHLDEEYLDEEYSDDEYSDDEYLNDEYLDEEYLDDEYLDEEYLDDEYLDEEYLDDEHSDKMIEYEVSKLRSPDVDDNGDLYNGEEIHNKAILSDYEDLTDEELAIILEGEKDEELNHENQEYENYCDDNTVAYTEKEFDNNENSVEYRSETETSLEEHESVDEIDTEESKINNIDTEAVDTAKDETEPGDIGYLSEEYLELPDDEDIKFENQNMEYFAIELDEKVLEKINDNSIEEETINKIYLDENENIDEINTSIKDVNDEANVDEEDDTTSSDENYVNYSEGSDDEEIANDKVLSDDSLGNDDIEDEYSDDKYLDDEYLDDEYLDDEYLDDEYLDDEYLDDEYLDDEYLDDEYLDDEYLDDEYLDDEYSDDEYLDDGYSDDEYLDDGYLDDEYLDDEYLDDEYLDDEYLDDGYLDERYNTIPLISSVNIDENFDDIIPEYNAVNLDSFASFGKVLKETEKVVDDIDNFEEKIRYNRSHILLQSESKELLEAFTVTYCKIRGMTSVRKVSIISGDKLNLLDIKELYRKIPKTFLIVKNAEDISEDTYNSIVKAVNFNDNTIIVFTTDKENISLESHLLDKMVAIKKNVPIVINDYVTYAILYAGIKGYKFTEYALEVINANIKEISSKSDSFASFEKVVNCSITKQKQYIEENLLNDLVVGNYKDETTISDLVVTQAIQELMDRNLI